MNKNRKKRNLHTFLAIFLVVLLLPGCSMPDWLKGTDNQLKTTSKTEQTFDYEVPSSSPSILVNQLGYYTDSVKTAIFIGEDVPDTFSVIDVDTKEEVFTGQIEHKGFQEDNTYISTGTFTNLTKSGEYYILCDTIGQSYHFEISDMAYDTLLNDMLKEISDNRWKNYHTESQETVIIDEEKGTTIETSGGWYTTIYDTKKVREVKSGSKTLVNLLLSAELYMEEHSDATGIDESSNEIPDILDEGAYEALWLLKMQDSKTGAVYSSLTEQGEELILGEQSIEACQHFIIAMAKFSYSMKSYDSAFATECLRASDAAWKYVESIRTSQKEEHKEMQTQIDESLRFFGATELFRASGAYRYHTVIKEYVPTMSDENLWTREEYLGAFTYLGTRLAVSKSLCEELMRQVMDLGETIAGESKENGMLAIGTGENENCQDLLCKMTIMTSIDYIIGNHEYDTILENNLHYMLGRNEKSYSYIEGYGNDEPIKKANLSVCDDLEQTSALIFMLSEIISNR